jgi:hypothetical protein
MPARVLIQSHLGLGFVSAGVEAVFAAAALLTSCNNKEAQ